MSPIDNLLHRTMTPIMGQHGFATPDYQPRPYSATVGLGASRQGGNPVPFSPALSYRQRSSTPGSRKGCRPSSTMQMLTDTVYRREAEKLSAANTMNNGRPYTADVANTKMIRSTFNPYQTSYKHEFYRKDEPEEMSVRPPSHMKFASSPLREETTYNKEYTGAKTTPNGRLWGGGNNPHPSEAFMVWKYPTRRSNNGTDDHSDHGPPVLTNEDFDKVMRGKTKSIYQSDFKGLPPGYMPAEFADVPMDWKSNVPYTIDSAQRISYQKPNQARVLGNNTKRFGESGHDRHRLLVGITPNASQRKKMIHSATTYDRHYNETAPLIEQAAGVHFPTKARTVVKGKGPEELSAMYENIKRQHFPRHARGTQANSMPNGYSTEVPLTPHSTIPRVSPGVGMVPIPAPNFITTPVPEPICEPV